MTLEWQMNKNIGNKGRIQKIWVKKVSNKKKKLFLIWSNQYFFIFLDFYFSFFCLQM